MILKSLIKFLDDQKIKYDIIEHRTVFTALDAAQTQHIKPEEVVKTLIVRIDNKPALALISAKSNLDKNKLKKTVNIFMKKEGGKAIKKVDFAKEVWMKKNLQGSVGATPPFGALCKLPMFVDGVLLKQKTLYVNTGDYKYSLKITRASFEKGIGDFNKGSFSVAKKIKIQKPVKKTKKSSKKKLKNKKGKNKVTKAVKKKKK